ncbi:MAG: thioredoxin family protein [Alphaproteobacteria bacterium]
MTRNFLLSCASAAMLAFGASAFAATTGAPAPQFTGTDSNGATHSLGDYKGKTVILEWTNAECPYVKKHYGTKNMQSLQTDTSEDGIVWLTVNSQAPGKQGYVTPEEQNQITKQAGAHPTAVLLDPDGKIGEAYSAKTTPHMYVIDASQTLVYQGAIDDKPTADWDSVKGAKNYVRQALSEMKAGKPVSQAETTAYGCAVKYGS